MKLLLVSLRDPYLDSDRVMPPLGVLSLKSYFGCDVTNDPETARWEDYTHIGISCTTPQRFQAQDTLKAIRSRNPKAKVILGGPHPTHYSDECSAYGFDSIVIGDGELALQDVLCGSPPDKRVFARPVSEAEMNRFPLPDRHPTLLRQYSYDLQGHPATTIVTAKGCPMSCAFCEDAGTRVRLYTPKNVSRQIDQCKDAGFHAVMFFDDIFTLSMNRVRDLASVIRPHKIVYRCFGHANTMTPEMAKILRSSGCIEIGFGAESGSQMILNVIAKRTTVAKNRRFVQICNDSGIRVKAFFILGLPGESRETIQDTERFLEELVSNGHKNDFDMTIFYPYRGTHIREHMDDYDVILSEHQNHLGVYKGVKGDADSVVSTPALSSDEISSEQQRLLRTYK